MKEPMPKIKVINKKLENYVEENSPKIPYSD